jgi:hypothetical protein
MLTMARPAQVDRAAKRGLSIIHRFSQNDYKLLIAGELAA